MKPTTNNVAHSVDGVSKILASEAPKSVRPITTNAAVKEELDRETVNSPQTQTPADKNKVKTVKPRSTLTITILVTLVITVLLIGLAYLAYNKSK